MREATAKSDLAAPAAFQPSTDPTSDKQAQMSQLTSTSTEPRRGTEPATSPRRSLHMQLMPEALARVHMQERLQEAEHERLVRAVHLRRRAERMTLKARKALAAVVMQ
ncbi:hypothetical protein [Streptacidiphilus carbonis]|uniref:hypothetical protein n=1 Tax=Streptacidiphilus carbonis TaxID=105422 RepID=UPI000B15CA9A|nr:hypothetical protein [Streptacidiphilus carbonis]